jgi:hypothetical protein
VIASQPPADPVFPEPCDRCGYSQLKDRGVPGRGKPRSTPLYSSSSHLADAVAEISVPVVRDGVPAIGHVYLCGHHFRAHEVYIASRGYKVRTWVT